jgi:hypothetical protein
MSEEIKDEVKTDHVPQLQPKGRKRTRPVGSPDKMIETLKEQNAALSKQLENVMALLSMKQSEQPNLMLPPKPHIIERPRGFEYEVERVKPEGGVTRPDVYVRVVPERPDNPNEPDPRYCVFCASNTLALTLKTKANLATEYDLELSATPTTEAEIREINRAHKDHLREIQGYESSKTPALHRVFKNHFHLTARKRGRVPDCVKFRTTGRRSDKDKEVALTAAQANELNMKQWEKDCQSVARNQGRY